MAREWFELAEASNILTPALLVYPDHVKNNIDRMIQTAGDPARLRTHVKTHKTIELVKLQLDKGISKFKCSTIAEAEMIAIAGGKDILLAYQPVGPNIGRFIDLQKHFTQAKFATIADNLDIIDQLSTAAHKREVIIHVYLDINVGMDRTGIQNTEMAIKCVQAITSAANLTFAGLHVYDGHIHDARLEDRQKHCDADFAIVTEIQAGLSEIGLELPNIIAGGTPTFPIHAAHPDRELSPGTPVLWDIGYQEAFEDLNFDYAALIATRVISQPGEHLYCLDLGSKSLASEMPQPRIQFFNLSEYEIISQSEEHLTIRLPMDETLQIGDIVYGSPTHICPSVALYEYMYVIENHTVINTWKILARSRKLTF